MAGRIFLLFLVALAARITALPFDDPCNIMPKTLPKVGETVTVAIQTECPKGQIMWDYPQGTLMVNFDPPHTDSFQLCLKGGHANYMQEMYSIVGTSKDRIQVPTAGHDACVSSHGGVVHLELVAPQPQFYMTIIPFTVSKT